MAASEDQAQAIVRDLVEVQVWAFDNWLGAEVRICFEFFLQTCLTSQAIDGLVFGCLDDPGARRFGNAVSSPLIDGCSERFLRCVFGKFKITKLTY